MSSVPIKTIARQLQICLKSQNTDSQADCNRLTTDLQQALSAWAVGLWKVEADHLRQILFATAAGFDPRVAEEFQQATRIVPLEQTELGIVNAVVNRRPAHAVATEQTGDLRQSASWLTRFQSACSLSWPLSDEHGDPQAVLAVSWKQLVEPHDAPAVRLQELADEIQHPG